MKTIELGIAKNQSPWLKGAHDHIDLCLPNDGYGPAITGVYELEDGSLWVDNGEYSSQVNYCPVCGYQAKNAVQNKD